MVTSLIDGFTDFRNDFFGQDKAFFKRLIRRGQHPKIMIISCSDSRVDPAILFGTRPGELFVIRNVANLVPPFSPTGDYHGTSAAIEYAVTSLGVAHIIVLGHSGCGGVNGCHAMCSGKAPELEKNTSFVGRWMDILRPGFERVKHLETEEMQIAALEREGVLVSLENLMSFPFVKQAVENDTLSLHGLWNDIGEGDLYFYNTKSKKFEPVL